MTATDLAEFLRAALDASDRACTNPEAGTAYALSYLQSAVRQAIHTLNNRAQVEQAEAERSANELCGPPVDSAAARAYRW